MLACKSAPLHIFVFRSRLCHISQRFLVAKAAQIHKSTSVRAKRCCKEQHRSLKRPGPKGQRRQSWQWPGPGRRKNLVMAALRGHPCGCTLVVVAWLRSKVCNIVSHTERPTSTSTGGVRCRWAWVSGGWCRNIRIYWCTCPINTNILVLAQIEAGGVPEGGCFN